jgi:hypothetical protein
MGTYAKNDTIRVVINKNPAGGYLFALDENNGKGPVQQVKFNNDGHPGTMVYFKIYDPDNTGLVFQPDPAQAMWVALGAGNPPAGAKWPGFVPLSVENNPERLMVYNRNLQTGINYKFTLRFKDPGGQAVEYDPIGNDQNGSR